MDVPSELRLVVGQRTDSGHTWLEYAGGDESPQELQISQDLNILGLSPNGGLFLAFRSVATGESRELVVIPVDGGEVRVLDIEVGIMPLEARWVNDSMVVVFDEYAPTMLIDLATNQFVSLPEPGGIVDTAHVAFSSSGRQLLALDQPDRYEWYSYDYSDGSTTRNLFPWLSAISIPPDQYLTDIRASWFANGIAVIAQAGDDVWFASGLDISQAADKAFRPVQINLPDTGLRTGVLAWESEGRFLLLSRFPVPFDFSDPAHIIGLDAKENALIDYCLDPIGNSVQGHISPDGAFAAWTVRKDSSLAGNLETWVLSLHSGRFFVLPGVEVVGWGRR